MFASTCLAAFAAPACFAGGGSGAPAPVYGLNAANTNVSPYTGVRSAPFIRWQIQHEAPSAIDSPALILDARGVLYTPYNVPVLASNGQDAGLHITTSRRDSTPAIDSSGNIYQWEGGRLHAYAPSGAPLWTGPTTNFSDGNGVKILPDGTVLAGGGAHTMFAYTPQGTQLWSAPSYQGNNAPPAIDSNGNSYVIDGSVGAGRYASYDRNGNQRWSVPWAENTPAGAPILGPDGNLYGSQVYGTSVYVHNAATGALIRHQNNLYGGIQAITADGTLYSCSYQTLRTTDLLGNIRWEAHVPSSSFFHNLVVDAAGKAYCTTEEGELFAFSSTGAQLWRLQMPAGGSALLSPVIGADGTLYVEDANVLLAVGGVVPAPGPAGLLALSVGALGLRRRR